MNRRNFITASAAIGAMAALGMPAFGRARGWRLALATHSYHELNLRRLLPRVVNLGAERIELNDNHVSLLASPPDLRVIRHGLERSGLKAIGSYTGRFSRDPAHNRRIFEVARALDFQYVDGYPPPELVPDLVALARDHGITLALLNTAGEEPYGSPDAIEPLLDRHPDLATVVDVGHYARADHDPGDVVRRFGERIVAIHAKDMTTTTGPESADPYTVIGTGVLDWPSLVSVLDAIDYSGFVTLSYTGNFWNYLEREPRIRASLENLRALKAGRPLPHDRPPEPLSGCQSQTDKQEAP